MILLTAQPRVSRDIVSQPVNFVAASANERALDQDAEEILDLCKDKPLIVPEEPKPSELRVQAQRAGIYLFYYAHEHPFTSGCIAGSIGMLALVGLMNWINS